MIKAHMTEEEILTEAEARLAYQKKYSNSSYEYTLQENIDNVRKWSAREDRIEKAAQPFVDVYYKFIWAFFDRKGSEDFNTFISNFRRYVLFGESGATEKLMIANGTSHDDRKRFAELCQVKERALAMACDKYISNFHIDTGKGKNPMFIEWESRMMEDLESRTNKDIM